MGIEFKVNPAVQVEVQIANVPVGQINSTYTPVDLGNISNCSGADNFEEYSKKTKSVFSDYKLIVSRDLMDIKMLADEALKLDQMISGSI